MKKTVESSYLSPSILLLQDLIRTPSYSREEDRTAQLISDFLIRNGVEKIQRQGYNVWVYNQFFDSTKPTILLNSHHDTVKPNPGYTLDPFDPIVRDGKLFGLGSNDAGGSLVALLETFLRFYDNENLNYNLCFAATAEEEISGSQGIASIKDQLLNCEFAIVGEPTQMQPAIAEKGLIVLDCMAFGRAGHAAREEGVNAIYYAIQDIEWLRTFQFPKISALLGPVKMSVTMIQAGTQHNVVPENCSFVVDVRVTEMYTNSEVVEIIQNNLQSTVVPRSLRLNSSSISIEHPIVRAAIEMGKTPFGSPTMSDQALLDIPSLKMGPGHSSRSHSADEYIYIDEIENAIQEYIQLLKAVL